MRHHTLENVIGYVTDAARGRTDFIYNPDRSKAACVYVDPRTGEPDCLIGRALVGAGVVDKSWFIRGGFNESEISTMARRILDHTFDDDAIDFMSAVQLNQDRGFTWGYAIEGGLMAVGLGERR
jgi:hypothetical protein